MEDGTWMLWENSSVIVAAVAIPAALFSDISLKLVLVHEWAPHRRWGAPWTVKIQVVAMHLLLHFPKTKKKRFYGPSTFMIVRYCVTLPEKYK